MAFETGDAAWPGTPTDREPVDAGTSYSNVYGPNGKEVTLIETPKYLTQVHPAIISGPANNTSNTDDAPQPIPGLGGVNPGV